MKKTTTKTKDSNLRSKPARRREEDSMSSDWVAELDAARDHIARLMNRAHRSGRPKLGHELCKAELALQVLVNAQRRRSATAGDERQAEEDRRS